MFTLFKFGYPAVSTPSLKQGGDRSTRQPTQRDTFFLSTTAHLFTLQIITLLA
jgi:hypothetical protein